MSLVENDNVKPIELPNNKGSSLVSGSGKKKSKKAFDLKDTIKTMVVKVERERAQDPMKKIPDGFISFTKDETYIDMLKAMVDYLSELFRLENRAEALKKEARASGLPVPVILPSEKKKLHEKAKKVADKYSWIVYRHKSLGLGSSEKDRMKLARMKNADLFKSRI